MGVFNFKQFSVNDDRAAMKVGTDAVLLGTWVNLDKAKSILDIGTGCGVIALILAQRTPAETKIDAIEMSEENAAQAIQNVLTSPWPDKVVVHQTRLQEYFPSKQYDLIVCNPPYFSGSQLPPAKSRASARHNLDLTADELLAGVQRLLAPDGKFSLILPTTEAGLFMGKVAGSFPFFQHRLTRFFSRKGKPQERSLLEFRKKPGTLHEDQLILYAKGTRWSDAYLKLVGDFYLDR